MKHTIYPPTFHKDPLTSIYKTSGFSLVEVMVALVLSLMIMIGVVQIFISSSSTHKATEGLSRAQENGRFAMDFLTQEIRMAGHMGCLRNVPIFNNLNTNGNNSDDPYDPTRGIGGFEADNSAPGDTLVELTENPSNTNGTASWTPALNVNLVAGSGSPNVAGAIPGTDAIVIYRLSINSVPLLGPNFHDSGQVFINTADATSAGFKDGDVLIVTDCEKASIFQTTNVQNAGGGRTNIVHSNAAISPGNDCANWGPPLCQQQEYGPDAEMARLETYVFYIARGAGGTPSLFRASLESQAAGSVINGEELVEGIENMQILYGVDTDTGARVDGDADTYLTAADVDDQNLWARVVSVRISIVAHSQNIDGTGTPELDTGTYLLNGATAASATTFDPIDDSSRRRVFNATVQLRNRGI